MTTHQTVPQAPSSAPAIPTVLPPSPSIPIVAPSPGLAPFESEQPESEQPSFNLREIAIVAAGTPPPDPPQSSLVQTKLAGAARLSVPALPPVNRLNGKPAATSTALPALPPVNRLNCKQPAATPTAPPARLPPNRLNCKPAIAPAPAPALPLENRLNQSKGNGSPLSASVRSFMEPRFGVDFSNVRVHSDRTAVQMNQELGAQAFAHGSDIYFGEGKTPGNNELTAHELTHVVQQTSPPSLQQKPESLQTKLTIGEPGDRKEVMQQGLSRPMVRVLQPVQQKQTVFQTTKAPSNGLTRLIQPQTIIQKNDRSDSHSSQSGTNQQQVTCPDTSRVDEIERNYRAMIAAARQRGANVAADNLEHFLAGSGATRILSVTWLRSFSAITSAERRNEGRFEESLNRLANEMQHGDRRTHADHWDAQLTGSGELYYASGTSTIRSTGNFDLEMIENIVRISGHVAHHWYDPYDWHAGLSAYVPGFGSISDEDGLIMQSCRGARPFQMEADWQKNLGGTIEVGHLWNTRNFTWTGP